MTGSESDPLLCVQPDSGCRFQFLGGLAAGVLFFRGTLDFLQQDKQWLLGLFFVQGGARLAGANVLLTEIVWRAIEGSTGSRFTSFNDDREGR